MAGSLPQRLEESAASVGYTGRIRGIPREVLRNQKLLHFLQWAVECLEPANCLSQTQLEKYEELKAAGVALEGLELRKALSQVEGREEKPLEHVRGEVSSLQASVSALKSQLQSLHSIQKHLNEHHASLVREREAVRRAHSESQRAYQQSLQSGEEDNGKLNASLEHLQSAVETTIAFHQPVKSEAHVPDRQADHTLLSQLPTVQYSRAEDRYLSELTAYTRKQFFQGIAVMAHTTEDAPCGVLDLEDPGSMLVKGISKEQYQKHCQELSRLKSLYPVVETQRVSDLLAEAHAVAVHRKAEEVLAHTLQSTQPDISLLRQQIKDKQHTLSQLQLKTQQQAHVQLPGLIQEMATLHVSRVLHGDYDLKIARQDYFTSKQDKVISHLLSQTARQELLSMLYELELRRHQGTHRLLSATADQLDRWKEEREKRTVSTVPEYSKHAMQNSAVLPVKETRQTIDSRDKFSSKMCSLLGPRPSAVAPLLTHCSLETSVTQLAHQMSTLEALLGTMETEQQHIMEEMISMTEKLGKQVFGPTGSGRPELTVKVYTEECSKLESVLSTVEQNIKRLLADYDSKKKALQRNHLIEQERKLFVYFFTDPQQLTRAVADLARRLDAVVAAQHTK